MPVQAFGRSSIGDELMQGSDVTEGVERKVADGDDGQKGQDNEGQNLPFAHVGGGLQVLNHTHDSSSCVFTEYRLLAAIAGIPVFLDFSLQRPSCEMLS